MRNQRRLSAGATRSLTTQVGFSSQKPTLADLIEGRADLGIVTTNAHIPVGLEDRPWRQDRLLAIVANDHPLAKHSAIRFSEVLDYPLVDVLEIGALALLLAEAAQRLGRSPDYRYHVTSMDAARRLVAAGHAINVMPNGMVEPYAAALGLKGIPIEESWALRRLRLVSRPQRALPAPAVLLLGHLLRPSDHWPTAQALA